MKIQTVKFVAGGSDGIQITGEEFLEKNEGTVIDTVTRSRKTPIPMSLRKTLDKLKPYYLMLTGHWSDDWNDLVEHGIVKKESCTKEAYTGLVSLLDKTEIRGISLKTGFLLTGVIKTLGNKVCCINTPCVVEQDEFTFFEEVIIIIQEIIADVKIYLEAKSLFFAGDSKQLLMEFYERRGKTEDVERVKEQEDSISDEEMILQLTTKGFVIYNTDEVLPQLEAHDEIPEPINLPGSIEKMVKEETLKEEKEIKKEKKKKRYDTEPVITVERW